MRTVQERLTRALGVCSLAFALCAPCVALADDTIELLKDVNPGPQSSGRREFVKMGGLVYFSAADGSDGYHSRLWQTDGTPGGTIPVPGSPLDPSILTPLGDALFFQATDGVDGYELWSYSPADGLFHEYDINLGPGSSSPVYLTAFQGSVYFRAIDAASCYGLWRFVPGDVSPRLVMGLSTAYYGGPDNLTVLGNALFFVAAETAESPRRLWRTEGVPGDETPVGPPGLQLPAPEEVVSLTAFRDRLFFAGDDRSDPHGLELWTSDGNPEDPTGTHLVVDLYPGTSLPGGVNSSSPGPFVPLNGVMHFEAVTADGVGLWKTDGTAGATTLVKHVSPFPDLAGRTLVPAGGLLFFVGRDQRGRELWRSDGTPDGTHLVADICNPDEYPDNPMACGPFFVSGEPHNSSNPIGLTAHAGRIYFSAYDPAYGSELFRSDGSTVELVADIYEGETFNDNWNQSFPNSSSATPIADIDGTLYFSADDGLVGLEPWTLRSWTPQEGIAGLIDDVKDLVGAGTLNHGQGHSLLVKLEQALATLEDGDTGTAVSRLEDFIHEVRAFERARRLTAAEADNLVKAAERVIASISG